MLLVALTLDRYQTMVQHLREQGIHTIEGNLILDDTSFNSHPYAQGWTWDDLTFGYAAPLTGFHLNQNQFQIRLTSAQTLYEQAKVEPVVDTPLLQIHAQLKTVTEKEAQSCAFMVNQKAHNLHIKGCWPLRPHSTTLSIANRDVKAYLKMLLANEFKVNQIKLKGDIIYQKASSLPHQHVFKSKPLHAIAEISLKESNNFYAESLLKALGYELKGMGTFHHGLEVMSSFLQEYVGLNINEFLLKDGSGLSQYNLISAHQLGRLLYVIYHDELYPLFSQSLAVSGIDGTLVSRLKSFDIQSQFRGKTGTLTGHSALSGYLEQENQTLIVTLLVNNSVHSRTQLKAVEDQVVLWLQQKRFS